MENSTLRDATRLDSTSSRLTRTQQYWWDDDFECIVFYFIVLWSILHIVLYLMHRTARHRHRMHVDVAFFYCTVQYKTMQCSHFAISFPLLDVSAISRCSEVGSGRAGRSDWAYSASCARPRFAPSRPVSSRLAAGGCGRGAPSGEQRLLDSIRSNPILHL